MVSKKLVLIIIKKETVDLTTVSKILLVRDKGVEPSRENSH